MTTRSIPAVAAVLALVCACAPLLPAQTTHTWDNTGAGSLASTAGNWDTDAQPVTGDHIVLDATSTADMTWDLDITVASWTQTAGYLGTVTIQTKFAG